MNHNPVPPYWQTELAVTMRCLVTRPWQIWHMSLPTTHSLYHCNVHVALAMRIYTMIFQPRAGKNADWHRLLKIMQRTICCTKSTKIGGHFQCSAQSHKENKTWWWNSRQEGGIFRGTCLVLAFCILLVSGNALLCDPRDWRHILAVGGGGLPWKPSRCLSHHTRSQARRTLPLPHKNTHKNPCLSQTGAWWVFYFCQTLLILQTACLCPYSNANIGARTPAIGFHSNNKKGLEGKGHYAK